MGGAVTAVVSGAANLVGGIINTGRKIIGGVISGAAKWVLEKISGISDTPSYTPESATIDQTKIVNQMISKCVDSYGKEAKKLEDFAKELLEEYLNKTIEILTPLENQEVIPSYIINLLEYETKVLKESIDNVYMTSIENTFSLNNSNLLDILQLDPGEEKQKKLQVLAISTLEKSNEIFKEKISKFFLKQQKVILKELNRLKQQIENSKISTEKEFKKIEDQKGKSQEALAAKICELQNIIDKLKLF